MGVGVATAHAQYVEVHDHLNYNYLAHMDPKFNPALDRFNDHNSFEAYLLRYAGQMLGDMAEIDAAHAQYTAYAAAKSAASPSYVAYAACHFARIDSAANDLCAAWVTANGADNAAGIGLVLDYATSTPLP